jgi:hypothetical protein
MRLTLAILFAIASAPAFAAPPPPCKGTEFRQLDFWLGDWHARWAASPGTPAGQGSNRITRSYEGRVIEEHFDGRPGMHLMGHSVSVYFAPAKEWRQTWVDNEGGYIDLTGGPDGKGNFVLRTLPRPGTPKASRMIFTDIIADSFTWRWQKTLDGRVWTDDWVIHYTREKSG